MAYLDKELLFLSLEPFLQVSRIFIAYEKNAPFIAGVFSQN